MQILALATALAADAVAAATAVDFLHAPSLAYPNGKGVTPFLPGREVVYHYQPNGVTGTPTTLIQGSPDGTTWTTIVTLATKLVPQRGVIVLQPYMRVNQSVVGTAGTVTVDIENGA